MAKDDRPCPGSKIRSKGKGRGLGLGGGKGPRGIPIGEKLELLKKKRDDDEDEEEEEMSEEKKAADQEGQARLMAFAVGIDRRCSEKDSTYDYSTLAKAAGVREEMLAPALVDVLIQASEKEE